MCNFEFTVEQFRAVALVRFSFLQANGFHREPSMEETTPTGGTVIYLGKNVGFIFSLDMRDQCVDGQVVKVRDGQIKRIWEGGYSADLFTHLVRHAGYRGGRGGSGKTKKPALEQMVDGWAELLKQAGRFLLSDKPESLPEKGTERANLLNVKSDKKMP